MAETAWVLERVYGLAGRQLAAVIERMLQVDILVIESEQEIFTAMTSVMDGRGSFADALIGALGARAGCSHTATFDRQALRLESFSVLHLCMLNVLRLAPRHPQTRSLPWCGPVRVLI
jgi:predicted nucleic-acid-binding protein